MASNICRLCFTDRQNQWKGRFHIESRATGCNQCLLLQPRQKKVGKPLSEDTGTSNSTPMCIASFFPLAVKIPNECSTQLRANLSAYHSSYNNLPCSRDKLETDVLRNCMVKVCKGWYTIPHEIMGIFAHAQTMDTRSLFLQPRVLAMRLSRYLLRAWM